MWCKHVKRTYKFWVDVKYAEMVANCPVWAVVYWRDEHVIVTPAYTFSCN